MATALSRRAHYLLTSSRGISSTPHLASLGWFEKIKQSQLYARITGKKPYEWPSESFTLLKFADSMDQARKLGSFMPGCSGDSTVGPAMEKHAAVLRYLATIDPKGEIQNLMGNTPLDVGNANLAKSGQISRNALCPCGSKKRYKRCCGAS